MKPPVVRLKEWITGDFFIKKCHFTCGFEKMCLPLHTQTKTNAQMAESVDALVSNTSGVTSIPVRPRVWVLQTLGNQLIIKGFSDQRKNLRDSLIKHKF